MNKTLKKALIAVAIVVGVSLAVLGVLILIKTLTKKPVNVYKVADVSESGYYDDMSEAYGEVEADKIQKVYLSSTQTVVEIFVKKGDEVKKGDPLLKFDTSLGEVEVKKAEISLEKTKLELSDDKQYLESLNTALISENINSQISALEEQLERENERIGSLVPKYPKLPLGSYSFDDPYYTEYSDDIDIGEFTDGLGSGEEKYVAFVTVEDEIYTDYKGVRFCRTGDGKLTFSFFDPAPLEGEYPETDDKREEIQKQLDNLYSLLQNSYSKEELARLMIDTENEIEQLEINVKKAEIEYKRVLDEVGDGIVYSNIDGIVRAVRDDVSESGEPAIEIDGGGGYYITCGVSEFDVDSLNPGDPVTVTSWSDGNMFDGEIVNVDKNNVYNSDVGFYSENANVSQYAVKVRVGPGNDMKEGDYVSVLYQTNDSDDSTYLMNMFIRYRDGKPYVYAKGDDGTLELRYIRTGKDMYGQYTAILEGLDPDDMIAFPYGVDVEEGAKTEDADIKTLYGDDYMYY